MIDPFEKVGAGLLAHALGKTPGEGVDLKKSVGASAQELFGFVRKRPVEAFRQERATGAEHRAQGWQTVRLARLHAFLFQQRQVLRGLTIE